MIGKPQPSGSSMPKNRVNPNYANGSGKLCGNPTHEVRKVGQEAAQHAIGVIRHLRKLLKGGSEGENEELDLAEVIQDAVHILQPEATKRGINLAAKGIESP